MHPPQAQNVSLLSFVTNHLVHWEKSKFPYEKELKDMINEIEQYLDVSQIKSKHIPSTKREIPKSSYNYWKDVICINAPEAFVNYQEFEARTRYFSGMFLSGLLGITVSLIMLFNGGWQDHTPSTYLLILSVVISIAFGSNIKRVRVQEVTTLTGLYLAYTQHVNSERE